MPLNPIITALAAKLSPHLPPDLKSEDLAIASALIHGQLAPSQLIPHLEDPHLIDLSSYSTRASGSTFIDLFAGIGGFRQALTSAGFRCVFTSEIDKHAKATYAENYDEVPYGDIKAFTSLPSIHLDLLPQHTILCGGFPCQPFSAAGRELGFSDTRGTLFFDILQIIKSRSPEVIFLENVKRLKSHDSGNTFKTICDALVSEGYKIYTKVLNARDFGLPQNRERIFIVGFKSGLSFSFPIAPKTTTKVSDILELKVDPKYYLTKRAWDGHITRKANHVANGKGFGYSLVTPTSTHTNTISARYYKDGSEALLDTGSATPRRLTERECASLQGFPATFKFNPSSKQAYKQAGNSVAIPVISAIANQIAVALSTPKVNPDRSPEHL